MLTPKQQAAFDRARYQFCLDVFNREEERREALERKAQFYLSLVALFLGAVFFKLEFLDVLGDLLTARSTLPIYRLALAISLASLALSLLWTLVAIVKSTWLLSYRGEFPADLYTALFDPGSSFMATRNESGLLQSASMALAVALEHNMAVNNQKSRWIIRSGYGMIVAVFSLACLLGLVTILSITS